ncbi:MAG: hypothetical protein HY364_04945 [Candidatus Aenigmarchaeota archaeon]|nr:hypothetical protein [Candidatus Aenigmarchaeota archaeon]
MFKLLMNTQGRNWKEYLTPQDEEKINEIIKKVAKHRGAYSHADDTKNAQLWCAVLEVNIAQDAMDQRLSELEGVFESMFQRMRFRENEKRELHKSLETF